MRIFYSTKVDRNSSGKRAVVFKTIQTALIDQPGEPSTRLKALLIDRERNFPSAHEREQNGDCGKKQGFCISLRTKKTSGPRALPCLVEN
jgi:hypothetical protein